MKTIKQIIKFLIIAFVASYIIFLFAESANAEEAPYYIDITDYIEYTSTQVTNTKQNTAGEWVYDKSAKYYYSIYANLEESELNQGKIDGFWDVGYFVAFYGAWAGQVIPHDVDYPEEKMDVSKTYEIYDPVMGGIPAYITNVPIDIPENAVLPEGITKDLIYSKAYKATDRTGFCACFLESGHGTYLNAEEKKLEVLGDISIDISKIKVYYFTGDIFTNKTEWYVASATNANNPILLDSKDYYEGVSLESNVISDLTYLEIPFTDYLNKSKKYGSLIAVNEALYKTSENSLVENELIAYIYDPSYTSYINKHPAYDLTFKLDKIERLIGNDYVDVSSSYVNRDNPLGNEHWVVIASYDNILKLKFHSKFTNNIQQKTLKEMILNEYSKNEHISNKITFKCTDIVRNWYEYSITEPNSFQTIQYIWDKTTPTAVAALAAYVGTEAEESTDFSSSSNSFVSYSTGTVNVEGKSVAYRFDTAQSLWDVVTLKDKAKDIFVCYFNVIDNNTGKAFTDEYQLNSITLQYFDVMITKTEKYAFNYGASNNHSLTSRDFKLTYFDSKGNTYLTENQATSEIKDKSELKPIIQTQKITPEDVELTFPKDNSKDGWLNYLALSIQGFIFKDSNNQKWKANTLFNTSKEEYIEDLSKASNYQETEFSGYQFACIYGSLEGYSSYTNQTIATAIYGSLSTVYSYVTKEVTEYHRLEITDFLDVGYNYQGKSYIKKVDHSSIEYVEDTQNPGDTTNPDNPFEKIPQENPWEKIWNKFVKFFNDAKNVIIGLVVGAVVVGAVIAIIKTTNNIHLARIAKNTSKKE